MDKSKVFHPQVHQPGTVGHFTGIAVSSLIVTHTAKHFTIWRKTLSQQNLGLRIYDLPHAPERVAEEVTGLGLTHLCDAVEAVGVNIGSVREHLGQAAVQVKRVGGGNAIQYALQAVAESVVEVLIGISAAFHLGQAVGMMVYDSSDLEKYHARGEMVEIRLMGVLVLNSVSAELARATIKSISVKGVFRASDEVKAALADRIVN